MQGGGEEEILRMTADTSGVVGPLQQIVGGLDAVDQSINKLAGGFQILDADALGIDKIREILYGVGQAVADDVIKVDELRQAFRDMMAGQDLTKALGLDQLAAMSQTASGRVAELRSQMAGLADENKIVTDSWLAEENAMTGMGGSLLTTEEGLARLNNEFRVQPEWIAEAEGSATAASSSYERYGQIIQGVDVAIMSLGQSEKQLAQDLLGLSDIENIATKGAQDFSQGLRTPGEAALLAAQDIKGMSDEATNLITRMFTVGESADEIKSALFTAFDEGRVSAAALTSGLEQVNERFAQLAAGATRSSESVTQVGGAAKTTATATNDLAANIIRLTEAFSKTTFVTQDWVAQGFAAKDLAAGIKELIASADAFSAAQAVMSSAAEYDVAALEKIKLAAVEAAQGLDTATLASSSSATKMVASAEAADTASTAQRGLFQTLADGVNEYISLAMVIGMVASAIGNFVSQGMQIEHTMNIIQGATQASDTQMQQWSSSMDQLGQKFGILQSDATPALDLITRAGFEGANATTVMSNAMELANTTGSKMADTTSLLTTALNVYGLGADQAHMVTQNLYSAFENSTLSMSQFDSFLQTSGLEAKDLGISIQDLLTTFGEVGNKVGGSNIALREMQGVLGGLSTFSDLTHTQLVKLAGGFDLTKFSAADASLKLLDLAKAANGNETAFTKMIGGMGNAQTVMSDLGISTKQLAINAANLGLAFDPVVYNSLDAAGKLQYLAGVADYSDSRFKALTKGGLENVNAALVNIMSSLDAAGQHLADTSAEFDKAKFNSEDFAQKLHQMADFLGGTGTAAFATYVGGAKNVPLALAIMGQEADNTGQKMSKAAADIARSSDTMRTHVDTSSQSFKDMDSAAGRTSLDAQTQSQKIGSAWQHLSDNFVRTYGPQITSALDSVAQGIDLLANGGSTTKAENNLKGLYAEFGAPLPQPTTSDQMTANLTMNANEWKTKMDQVLGTDLPSIAQRHAPSMHQQSLDYFHQMSLAEEQGKQNLNNDLTREFGTYIPGVIEQKKEVAYQATLDYLHRLANPPSDWQKPIRTQITDTFDLKIPSDIRQGAPQAYADELNYLHTLSNPDPGWKNGVRSEVSDTFQKIVPQTIRNASPTARSAEVDYLNSLKNPPIDWEADIKRNIDDVFGWSIPAQIENHAPSAHQAELDYLHQLAHPPTNWQDDIKHQVDDLFGNNIPAKIRNHAPDAYQATLDYLHQMSTGASTGNQQIVDNTGKTYKDDVPAAISSGQAPATAATDAIIKAQEQKWKELHTSLVGASIVPDMMTAIAAAIAAGTGPSSSAATLVTAAVQTVFAAEAAPAYASGLNAANQFAAGITAGRGAAVAAANATAAAVAAILAHHSPPKEGPMKDDDTWMPNMMNMFASGITNNIGKMQLASHQAALAVGGGLNMSSSSSSGMSTAPIVSLLSQLLNAVRQQTSQGSIGRPALPANLGSVTQQFGSVNFNSNMSPQQLYAQLNKLSGLALEDASRGAVYGMGY